MGWLKADRSSALPDLALDMTPSERVRKSWETRKARGITYTPEEIEKRREAGRRGGAARAAKLSPERRIEISQLGNAAPRSPEAKANIRAGAKKRFPGKVKRDWQAFGRAGGLAKAAKIGPEGSRKSAEHMRAITTFKRKGWIVEAK